jgi:hypothetical protein
VLGEKSSGIKWSSRAFLAPMVCLNLKLIRAGLAKRLPPSADWLGGGNAQLGNMKPRPTMLRYIAKVSTKC